MTNFPIKLIAIVLATALLVLPVESALAQSSSQASARQKAIADLKLVAYAGDVERKSNWA